MISIYIDEDVDVLLKPLLGAKGYSVIIPINEGMLSKSDTVPPDKKNIKTIKFFYKKSIYDYYVSLPSFSLENKKLFAYAI